MFGGSSHLHEENIRHDFQDTTNSVCSGKMKFLVTILFYCVIYLNEILVLRNLSNNSEKTAEENNLIIINLLLYEKKSLNNLVTLIFRMLTSNSYLKKKQRILIKKTNNIGLE